MRAVMLLVTVLLVSSVALAQDASPCTSPQIACSGSCVDPTSDPTNCGACGTVCLTNPATDAAICSGGSCVPVKCDGGLCDSTDPGTTCNASPPSKTSNGELVIAGVAAALALVLRRRRRAVVACPVVGLLGVTEPAARAAAPQAVDVSTKDVPPPRRYVTIAWNPVPVLMLGKVSFDVVIAPVSHHALVLSPFYVSTSTVPLYLNGPSGPAIQVPQQTFTGWGGEIGYRYYFGLAGPRGFFLGPSFIVGAFTATAQNGAQTSYWNLGGAIDVGYQMLVADRVSLAAGVGLQYTFTDKSLPNQQWPENIYANDRFNPRFLLSLGFAF